MHNNLIKYHFSLKTKEELESLTHEELLKYVKDLQDNSIQEKPPKNSNNSSISPSSEIAPPDKPNNKNQSLRKKSSKSVGAQLGREGVTLIRSDTPNEVIELPFTLSSCKKCGIDISAVVATLKERRQVVDLELSSINTKITEYQSFSKKCLSCGYDNHDNNFLVSVMPNVSYGKTIIAIVSRMFFF